MRSEVGLIEVSVGERAPIWFSVDPDADDPIADHLLEYGSFDGLPDLVALDLVGADMRVLDFGYVSGTFALPAAALGAEVAALDMSGTRLELLRSAASRNGFTNLTAIRADEVPGSGPAPWPGIDAVLEHVGWAGIDMLRMQAGGAEPLLLEKARCLRGERRPAAIVFDCDAAALARLGASVPQLHAIVAELGYRLFLIDTVVAGALVETAPGDIQPGNREAYVALTADMASAPPGWHRTPRLDRDELVRRVIDNAATDEPVERTYAAELMATGPAWLRADPAVPAALAALEGDISPIVRAATTANVTPSVVSGGTAPPESPEPQATPPALVLLARNVSVRSPGAGFERPAGTSRPHELVLSGLSTHLRTGTVLGLLVEDEGTAPELLSVLAGIARVADGELSTRARPLLVSRLDRLVEPALSVAENIVVLGVIFGGAVSDIVARTPEIAERAGVRPHLDRRLAEISGVDLGRLGLVLALDFAAGSLLLIDALGELGDAGFRRWAHGRIAELLATGASIVQAVRDPSHLLRQPDRLLWVSGGRVAAAGHPESVSFGFRHRSPRPGPTLRTPATEALAAS